MKFVLFFVVLLLSFAIGTFGFCQIVGTIKYFKFFKPSSAIFTMVLWLAILGFAFFSVVKWFNEQLVALYIGYAISFIISLGTKRN